MSVSAERQLQRTRRLARQALVQAFYQLQMTAQPWQDLFQQYSTDPDLAGLDRDFFQEALSAVATDVDGYDKLVGRFSDIAPKHLDPLEHGVLWMAVHELKNRLDIPYRVVISEAVELTKKFGATDGHKFVNGVLDRAAHEFRALEQRSDLS